MPAAVTSARKQPWKADIEGTKGDRAMHVCKYADMQACRHTRHARHARTRAFVGQVVLCRGDGEGVPGLVDAREVEEDVLAVDVGEALRLELECQHGLDILDLFQQDLRGMGRGP